MKLSATGLTALTGGFAIWLGISLAGGGGEAWDHGSYWSVGLPLLYLFAAVLGSGGKNGAARAAWQIGLYQAAGQGLGLLITGSGGFSLLPLGMILLVVLALPAVAAARLGRALGSGLRRGA